jgi:hypothetical protein
LIFLVVFTGPVLNAQTGNTLINQKLLANPADKAVFEQAEALDVV